MKGLCKQQWFEAISSLHTAVTSCKILATNYASIPMKLKKPQARLGAFLPLKPQKQEFCQNISKYVWLYWVHTHGYEQEGQSKNFHKKWEALQKLNPFFPNIPCWRVKPIMSDDNEGKGGQKEH